MENALTVPENDTTYIYNPANRRYEVLDLKTGRLIETVDRTLTPAVYCLQTCDAICDHIRSGKTLRQICQIAGMPSQSRFYHWLAVHPELRQRYEQARLQRADAFHDKAIEEAMNPELTKDDVPAAKLRVDTLKWAAEKASPEYYGKQDKVSTGTSISVTLHTGVLDTKAPTDIVIDEFGNFKGFNNGTEQSEEAPTIESSGTLAKAERWAVSDSNGIGDSEAGIGEEAAETTQS